MCACARACACRPVFTKWLCGRSLPVICSIIQWIFRLFWFRVCLSMVRSGFRSARDSVRTDRPMHWNRPSFENNLPFPTFHQVQRLIEILFQCCNYMLSPSLRLSSVVMFTKKKLSDSDKSFRLDRRLYKNRNL